MSTEIQNTHKHNAVGLIKKSQRNKTHKEGNKRSCRTCVNNKQENRAEQAGTVENIKDEHTGK